jgi:hypothetical protein
MVPLRCTLMSTALHSLQVAFIMTCGQLPAVTSAAIVLPLIVSGLAASPHLRLLSGIAYLLLFGTLPH